MSVASCGDSSTIFVMIRPAAQHRGMLHGPSGFGRQNGGNMYSGDRWSSTGELSLHPPVLLVIKRTTSSSAFPVTFVTVSDSSDVLDRSIPAVAPRLSVIDEPIVAATHRDLWHRRYAAELVAIDLIAAMFAVATSLLLRAVLPRYSTAHDDPRVLISFAIALPITWVARRRPEPGLSEPVRRRRPDRVPARLPRVLATGRRRRVRRLRGQGRVGASRDPRRAAADARLRPRRPLRRPQAPAPPPAQRPVDDLGRRGRRRRLGRGVHRDAAPRSLRRHAGHRRVPADRAGRSTPTRPQCSTSSVSRFSATSTRCSARCTVPARTPSPCCPARSAPTSCAGSPGSSKGTDTDLVVSPGLTEVAGTRLHIQPVAGLPLLHVEEPEFTGFRRFLKAAFDRTVAAVILALARAGVRRPSRSRCGSPRAGRRCSGRPESVSTASTFTMIKFRSMYVDAESAPGRVGGVQRQRRRPAVQGQGRPADHPGRPDPAQVLARRAAAVVQRAQGRHVARRSASAAAGRGRAVRRRRAPPAAGQARA